MSKMNHIRIPYIWVSFYLTKRRLQRPTRQLKKLPNRHRRHPQSRLSRIASHDKRHFCRRRNLILSALKSLSGW